MSKSHPVKANLDNATKFNQVAWDNIATSRHEWFSPVTSDEVSQARNGDYRIRLTGTKNVPDDWVKPVTGKRVLCLAAGGGHQGPILAAAGAEVTVFDISEKQLEIDRAVASENDLTLRTIQGDIQAMDSLDDGEFDLIVNPCSVNFCPDVLSVWKEAHRVLRSGGEMLVGLINPINYLFDQRALDKGKFVVRHKIPYSDIDLPEDEREETLGPERPIDFGHSLADLIGGQLKAGFEIVEMFEDRWGGGDPLSKLIDVFVATRARKC